MAVGSRCRPTRAGSACDPPVVDITLAFEPSELLYTLLGVRPDGVASVVDLVAADDLLAARRSAEALLREHQSCSLVEVWCDGALVDQLARRRAH
jgi:hypothetical protein